MSKFSRIVGLMFPAVFWLLGTLFLLSAFRFLSVLDTAVRIGIGLALIVLAVVIRRETKREVENG